MPAAMASTSIFFSLNLLHDLLEYKKHRKGARGGVADRSLVDSQTDEANRVRPRTRPPVPARRSRDKPRRAQPHTTCRKACEGVDAGLAGRPCLGEDSCGFDTASASATSLFEGSKGKANHNYHGGVSGLEIAGKKET